MIRIRARNRRGVIRTDFGARWEYVGRDCANPWCRRPFTGRVDASPQFYICRTCVLAGLIALAFIADVQRAANPGFVGRGIGHML